MSFSSDLTKSKAGDITGLQKMAPSSSDQNSMALVSRQTDMENDIKVRKQYCSLTAQRHRNIHWKGGSLFSNWSGEKLDILMQGTEI